MANDLQMSPQLEHIHGEIRDNFRALANGFQKLDKIKDSNRQSKQLEELTGRMRECKRLIKEMDREVKDEEARNAPEVNKQLNDEKQSMIKELNSYVALRKTYMNSLGNKRVELFDVEAGVSEPTAEENVQVASTMSNQELINARNKTMDETDQAIERSKMVVEQIIEVGTQTASTLKGQTDEMGRIVNELDTIQFSIKKASQLVKEIGRQKSNSRMPENQQVIGLSWEPKLPTLFSTTKTDNNGVNKFQNHGETSSLWRPNTDLVDGLFVPPNDPKKQNKLLKKQVKDTAGKSWFDMPAPTITSELKKDLQLLKLRSVIDPKRHYKKGDAKSKTLPKYFQVGTVIESSADFFSSRLTKKERKPNLADELLCDPNLGHYRKRKVREIEKQNHPAGNEKWKIRGRQSQKRAKQRRH